MKSYLSFLMVLSTVLSAQDQVDVTFRYSAPSSPTIFVVGEFNGWNNSANAMDFQGNNLWTKTVRLAVGGNPNPPANGVPGAWQYKFFYAGASPWPNDPLNHNENSKDNSNTFIYTKDVTIYHFLPNQKQAIIKTNTKLDIQIARKTTLYPTSKGIIFPFPITSFPFTFFLIFLQTHQKAIFLQII